MGERARISYTHIYSLVQGVYHLIETTDRSGTVIMVLLNSCAKRGVSMVRQLGRDFPVISAGMEKEEYV